MRKDVFLLDSGHGTHFISQQSALGHTVIHASALRYAYRVILRYKVCT